MARFSNPDNQAEQPLCHMTAGRRRLFIRTRRDQCGSERPDTRSCHGPGGRRDPAMGQSKPGWPAARPPGWLSSSRRRRSTGRENRRHKRSHHSPTTESPPTPDAGMLSLFINSLSLSNAATARSSPYYLFNIGYPPFHRHRHAAHSGHRSPWHWHAVPQAPPLPTTLCDWRSLCGQPQSGVAHMHIVYIKQTVCEQCLVLP